MGKGKAKGGAANKHLQARISYLQKAAMCIAHTQPAQSIPRPHIHVSVANETPGKADTHQTDNNPASRSGMASGMNLTLGVPSSYGSAFEAPLTLEASASGGLPNFLATQVRQVAQKAIIRLAPETKHCICRRCSAVLVEGKTCRKRKENLSKGGRKPWAETLVIECLSCGAIKRFPIGARRQRKKDERKKNSQQLQAGSNG